MFSLLNVVSGPSTISPLAPILYLPRRPAVNVSPGLPVMRPDASAAAAWPARYPTSLGTQSWNSSTVPLSTNLRIWFGKPRPVSLTLPFFGEVDRYRAAAATPTVVGEMMPFRFGYADSSPCVCWKDF